MQANVLLSNTQFDEYISQITPFLPPLTAAIQNQLNLLRGSGNAQIVNIDQLIDQMLCTITANIPDHPNFIHRLHGLDPISTADANTLLANFLPINNNQSYSFYLKNETIRRICYDPDIRISGLRFCFGIIGIGVTKRFRLIFLRNKSIIINNNLQFRNVELNGLGYFSGLGEQVGTIQMRTANTMINSYRIEYLIAPSNKPASYFIGRKSLEDKITEIGFNDGLEFRLGYDTSTVQDPTGAFVTLNIPKIIVRAYNGTGASRTFSNNIYVTGVYGEIYDPNTNGAGCVLPCPNKCPD